MTTYKRKSGSLIALDILKKNKSETMIPQYKTLNLSLPFGLYVST